MTRWIRYLNWRRRLPGAGQDRIRASFESPVRVEIPNFRFETARVLAVWSDPVLQQRLWIDHESKGFEWLYYQLGDVMDTYDLLPTVESPEGSILANEAEINAFNHLGAAVDRVLTLEQFDWEDATTYLADPLWHDAMRLSRWCLRLIILDGGCWDDELNSLDDPGQVSDVPARSLAAQCLASLAWAVGPASATWIPPLLRAAAESAGLLVDRLAAVDPRPAIGRIWRDGHQELERVAALGTLITNGADPQAIASAADRALWAVVRNRGGWDYTGAVPPQV